MNADGKIIMDIETRVSAAEMRHWPPACIRAFFDGVAQSVSAIHAARVQIAARVPEPAARPTEER